MGDTSFPQFPEKCWNNRPMAKHLSKASKVIYSSSSNAGTLLLIEIYTAFCFNRQC